MLSRLIASLVICAAVFAAGCECQSGKCTRDTVKCTRDKNKVKKKSACECGCKKDNCASCAGQCEKK